MKLHDGLLGLIVAIGGAALAVAASRLPPTPGQAYGSAFFPLNLGVVLEKQGDVSGASAVYAQCIRDFPEDAVARARLAALYRDSGQLDDAWRLAREALVREPRTVGAYRVLAPCTVTLLTERRARAPRGANGGRDGAPGENLLNGERLPAKCRRELAPGDVLEVRTPGGGGWGEPPP